MVAPDSVDKAKKVLDDAGIENQVSTLDVQRYVHLGSNKYNIIDLL